LKSALQRSLNEILYFLSESKRKTGKLQASVRQRMSKAPVFESGIIDSWMLPIGPSFEIDQVWQDHFDGENLLEYTDLDAHPPLEELEVNPFNTEIPEQFECNDFAAVENSGSEYAELPFSPSLAPNGPNILANTDVDCHLGPETELVSTSSLSESEHPSMNGDSDEGPSAVAELLQKAKSVRKDLRIQKKLARRTQFRKFPRGTKKHEIKLRTNSDSAAGRRAQDKCYMQLLTNLLVDLEQQIAQREAQLNVQQPVY